MAPKEEPLLSESEKKDSKSEASDDTGNMDQSAEEEGMKTLKLVFLTSITHLEQKNILNIDFDPLMVFYGKLVFVRN